MRNTILMRNNGLTQNKSWQIKKKSDMTENALIRVLHIWTNILPPSREWLMH